METWVELDFDAVTRYFFLENEFVVVGFFDVVVSSLKGMMYLLFPSIVKAYFEG